MKQNLDLTTCDKEKIHETSGLEIFKNIVFDSLIVKDQLISELHGKIKSIP
jgi:hypothetical protein